jgi:hypothetical protein
MRLIAASTSSNTASSSKKLATIKLAHTCGDFFAKFFSALQ